MFHHHLGSPLFLLDPAVRHPCAPPALSVFPRSLPCSGSLSEGWNRPRRTSIFQCLVRRGCSPLLLRLPPSFSWDFLGHGSVIWWPTLCSSSFFSDRRGRPFRRSRTRHTPNTAPSPPGAPSSLPAAICLHSRVSTVCGNFPSSRMLEVCAPD